MAARRERARSRYAVVGIVAALIIAGSAACGGSGGGGSSSQSNYPTDPSSGSKGTGGTTSGERTSSISVVNSSYSPTATTVARGTVVQWTWNSCDSGYGGETCTAHTVTFDDGPSSELQDKGSYSRAFNSAGTYRYHCQVHGTSMSGSVVVE
jgi:plastocyanin